jgi:hypothetical protein
MAMRHLTLKLMPKTGGFVKFLAFLNGHLVIAEDGGGGGFDDDVPTSELRLKVRAFGVGAGEYELSIDLPGTTNDQSLTLQLSPQGYHELELLI